MEQRDILTQRLGEWQHVVMRHSMHALFHYSRRSGMSMPQLMTLFKIHRSQHCGVTTVGEELGVTSAAASQMLDRLVQLGLVERREDPDDRRGKVISLSPEGERIMREAVAAQRGWIRSLAESYPPEGLAEAALVLGTLIEAAGRLDDPLHHEARQARAEDL